MPHLENARRRHLQDNTSSTGSEAPFHLQLPALEDAAAIQRAISVVVSALASGALEAGRGRTILYGLQIASSNARRLLPTDERHQDTEPEEAAATCEVSQTKDTPPSLNTGEESLVKTTAAPTRPEELLTESTSETQNIDTSSPATHITELSVADIPPSCASRTNGYKGSAHDRLHAFRQKGLAARSVTRDGSFDV